MSEQIELKYRDGYEPNLYLVIKEDKALDPEHLRRVDWVACVRLNGELMPTKQREIMDAIVRSLKSVSLLTI